MPLREMKRTLLIITLCLSTFLVSAQTEKQADLLFQDKHYEEALAAYKHLLKRSPKNQLYLYRTARCLEETSQTEEAITFFEKAGDRYDLKHLHLAMLRQQDGLILRLLTYLEADPKQVAAVVENDLESMAPVALRHADAAREDRAPGNVPEIVLHRTGELEARQIGVPRGSFR